MKKRMWVLSLLISAMLQLIITLPLIAGGIYTTNDLALTPGEDESKLNFAWITDAQSSEQCAVQIAKKNIGFKKSDIFKSTKAYEIAFGNDADYYYCEVDVSNLKNQVDYIYRVGDGTNWSGQYNYSTRNKNDYGFVYLSDAQIGASVDSLLPPPPPGQPPQNPTEEQKKFADAQDTAGWQTTLATIYDKFPKTAFILSAGDQIEVPGRVAEWNGFFSPAALKSIPIAPTPSSHDELGSGKGAGPVSSYSFNYHFNLPNENGPLNVLVDINNCPPGQGSCTPNLQPSELAAGDYYFTYGKALFMVLNMDATGNENYDNHAEFMKAAIEANPDVNWRIVMWHYTIYTAAKRGMNPADLRSEMVPILEDLNIDLVLMGHDHVLCRTYQMLDDLPQKNQVVGGRTNWVYNPTGILYMTADSASGSKYYDLDLDASGALNSSKTWVAAYSQLKVPTFSYVDVDQFSLKISTYRTDTMKKIDTYTMIKVCPTLFDLIKKHPSLF
jgi:hypothetical protein